MIELIVLLNEVIHIVGNLRRTVAATGFSNHTREIGKSLNERNLLVVWCYIGNLGLHSSLGCLAKKRLNACVGVLDKRSGVSIEVNRLLRVERHILARINLQNEVFKRTQTYDACNLGSLSLRNVVELAHLSRNLACIGNHLVHKIIGINHSALTRLHLALRKLYHTIGEVHKVLAPLESELVEQKRKHLEVVVLLIAHHVDHLVDGIVLIAEFCSTDILSHIHRSAIAAEQKLMVESVTGEVGPHRAIFAAIHDALIESFEHLLLTFKISVALVVYLIEINAKTLVGLIKSGINPLIHHAPHTADTLITCFPLLEHLASLLHKRRSLLRLLIAHTLLLEGLQLRLIVLVEEHIKVADEVVALLSGSFRRNTIAPLLPSKHRLTDVNTAVIHNICFHHLIAISLHDERKTVTKQIVANMA